MIFGFTGASGVGKTTLAKKVAEDLGITFQATSITESARKAGFNAIGDLTLADRLVLQEHLLMDHIELIKSVSGPVIFDRTPIDMIGYMFAEINMHSHTLLTPEMLERAEQFKENCLEGAAMYFDSIFVLRQLDEYEAAPTRPADNRAYQSHSQLIMCGAASEFINYGPTVYRVETTEFDDRLDTVSSIIEGRVSNLAKARRKTSYIH